MRKFGQGGRAAEIVGRNIGQVVEQPPREGVERVLSVRRPHDRHAPGDDAADNTGFDQSRDDACAHEGGFSGAARPNDDEERKMFFCQRFQTLDGAHPIAAPAKNTSACFAPNGSSPERAIPSSRSARRAPGS